MLGMWAGSHLEGSPPCSHHLFPHSTFLWLSWARNRSKVLALRLFKCLLPISIGSTTSCKHRPVPACSWARGVLTAPSMLRTALETRSGAWSLFSTICLLPQLRTFRSLERSVLSCTARLCSSGGRRFAVIAFSCLSRSLFTLSRPARSWRP